jgi:hypothetical protein
VVSYLVEVTYVFQVWLKRILGRLGILLCDYAGLTAFSEEDIIRLKHDRMMRRIRMMNYWKDKNNWPEPVYLRHVEECAQFDALESFICRITREKPVHIGRPARKPLESNIVAVA